MFKIRRLQVAYVSKHMLEIGTKQNTGTYTDRKYGWHHESKHNTKYETRKYSQALLQTNNKVEFCKKYTV